MILTLYQRANSPDTKRHMVSRLHPHKGPEPSRRVHEEAIVVRLHLPCAERHERRRGEPVRVYGRQVDAEHDQQV